MKREYLVRGRKAPEVVEGNTVEAVVALLPPGLTRGETVTVSPLIGTMVFSWNGFGWQSA